MAAVKAKSNRRKADAPRKGDLREQAILDAAEALLEREGIEPVTVEQIAKGAGISRGSLYFYFGSKEEVLTALVARTVAVILEDANTAAEEIGVEPKKTVERAVRATEKQWREHGVVMRAAVEHAPFIPEVDELWRGTVEAYIGSMARVLVRGGIPEGRGPAGARSIAQALCWMTERNFYMAVFAGKSQTELRKVGKSVMELWWRAMGIGPS